MEWLIKIIFSPEVIKAVLGSGAVLGLGKYLLDRSKERSARLFKVTSKVYRNVNDCVKRTTVEMIARRTTIAEIHNGGVWLSNHPIYRLTITHDAPREGVDSVAHLVKEQITTGSIMALLVELDRDRVKYIADISEVNCPDLKRELSRFGSRSLWMYMLKNRKGRPMGVFTVAFDKPNMLDNPEIERLMRRVHHIEELMQ